MTLPLLALPEARVGGLPFRVASLGDAVSAVVATAAGLRDDPGPPWAPGVAVHFANAYTVALADTDQDYGSLFGEERAAVFTDGMPVAWAGRRLHVAHADTWHRVYGPDVMAGVLAAGEDGPNHYLLGGSKETLKELTEAISQRWPGARVVGAESPPFRPPTADELRERDQRIAESGATAVWVGLGTPKQDWEVNRIAQQLPVVALAVGAAFDFLAGSKPQAPAWMQRSGTEWVYRWASEPKRLTSRYLWGNPRFVVAVWRHRRRRDGSRAGAGPGE